MNNQAYSHNPEQLIGTADSLNSIDGIIYSRVRLLNIAGANVAEVANRGARKQGVADSISDAVALNNRGLFASKAPLEKEKVISTQVSSNKFGTLREFDYESTIHSNDDLAAAMASDSGDISPIPKNSDFDMTAIRSKINKVHGKNVSRSDFDLVA